MTTTQLVRRLPRRAGSLLITLSLAVVILFAWFGAFVAASSDIPDAILALVYEVDSFAKAHEALANLVIAAVAVIFPVVVYRRDRQREEWNTCVRTKALATKVNATLRVQRDLCDIIWRYQHLRTEYGNGVVSVVSREDFEQHPTLAGGSYERSYHDLCQSYRVTPELTELGSNLGLITSVGAAKYLAALDACSLLDDHCRSFHVSGLAYPPVTQVKVDGGVRRAAIARETIDDAMAYFHGTLTQQC